MSQVVKFLSTRNMLDLDFSLNFCQVAPNSLLIFLQMLENFPLMPLKFNRCISEQPSSLDLQCIACDTIIHLIQLRKLIRRPSLLCLTFKSTRSFPHFRTKHCGSLCNCNMNDITSCLIFLSCSFEACMMKYKACLPCQRLAP